jgi:hypothetical protein
VPVQLLGFCFLDSTPHALFVHSTVGATRLGASAGVAIVGGAKTGPVASSAAADFGPKAKKPKAGDAY